MGAAMGGGASNDAEWQNAVDLKVSTQKVTVPCTRNTYKQYSVKVPRVVREKVPRTVKYVDMEKRTKQVPYTTNRVETRYRNEMKSYQAPVTRRVTKMVSVKSKQPRTIMVDVVKQVPKTEMKTTMVNKQKNVRVPYTVNLKETKFSTVTEQVPVNKSKVVVEDRVRTVFDTQVRTRCVPVTKMVTKQIPVYTVVAKPAGNCPPGTDCGSGAGAGGMAMGGAMGGGMAMGGSSMGGGAMMGGAMGGAMGGGMGGSGMGMGGMGMSGGMMSGGSMGGMDNGQGMSGNGMSGGMSGHMSGGMMQSGSMQNGNMQGMGSGMGGGAGFSGGFASGGASANQGGCGC